MNISGAAAQEIVEEIGHEIHENVNMMDEEGYIIASTDAKRIGQMHEGARRVLKEGLSEFFVTEEMETETMKRGINLPITVHDTTIGVIGITGPREKVYGYGSIVRRMTEIMVTESIRQISRRYGHRITYRFLGEWIEASAVGNYKKEFRERGQSLGIDITKPYRMIAMTFLNYTSLSLTLEGQQELDNMESDIRREAARMHLIYLRRPPYQILFVPVCDDQHLENIAKRLRNLISSRYYCTLAVGCDAETDSHFNLKKAADQADAALEYALHLPENIGFYDRLGIEYLIQKIPEAVKASYEEKFLSRIPEEKSDEYMKIIRAYFQYDGSIQRMSEALYLHKNTLQYKLRKLKEYTGRDIRTAYGSAEFLIALTIRENRMKR